MIPVWLKPWTAKGEISRLSAENEKLKNELFLEREFHHQTKADVNSHRDKLSQVAKWIITTHGLGSKVAGVKVVDLMDKRTKVEFK